MILQKLRYFRESGQERHLRDITAMLRVSGTLVDMPVLAEWIGRLSLEAEWRRVSPRT